MTTKYQQVKQDFLSGRLKGCRDYFESHNYPLETGYCYMVLDNFAKAKEQFEKAKIDNIRGHWGLMLLQMIEEKISMSPTYFEVRNFLEIDLDIFITYCKGEIVQQIIKYADFMAFYNWAITNGYSFGLSIDRIDYNGNYEPSNCRWADIKTQANNKSNVRKFEYNGEHHTMTEWSELMNINYGALWERLNVLGWSIEKALTTPVRDDGKH